jgi:hypothetical protein
MALDFVEHLKTNPKRCLHAGSPPTVVGRPALHAAGLPLPAVQAAAPIRRAIAVALATLADEQAFAAYSGLTGTLDALRGGTYVVGQNRVRFVAARVVTDAITDGTLQISGRGTRAMLRLHGHGVPRSQLTLRPGPRTTRITGSVGASHISVQVASR